MSEKLKNLLTYKSKLINNDNLCLLTKNKENGNYGVGSFWTNGQEMITVYEGCSDGSDDKDMSYNDFITNYEYKIGMDGENYE